MFSPSKVIQGLLQKLVLLVILFYAYTGQAQDKETSVLFAGNSYTYYWNMPLIVQKMADSQGEHFIIQSETAGGVNWKQHLQEEAGLTTKSKISDAQWDFVVLQNNSMSTINNQEEFRSYGTQLIKEVQQSGGVVLLFETWARANNPAMQQTITREYELLGSKMGVNTVPVGQMWKILKEKRPNIPLYDTDGSHPSPTGTYVTACMFYATLTGKSCSSLPTQINTTRNDGVTPFLLVIDAADADFIKKMVDEFLELNEQSEK